MLRDEQLPPFGLAVDLERMARDELAQWLGRGAVADRARARRRKIEFGAASGGGMAPDGPVALVGYCRDRIAELRAFVVAPTTSLVRSRTGSA